MRRLSLALCLFLATAASAHAQSRSVADEESRLLTLVNEYRAQHGAPALALSESLQRAADAHSRDMATRDYFEHANPEGQSPFDRVRLAGYPSTFVGENLAAGNADARATFEQWRHSPAHDAALRDRRYHAAGLARADRRGSHYRYYWTLDLGDRVEASAGAATSADRDTSDDAGGDDAYDDDSDEGDDDDDDADCGEDDADDRDDADAAAPAPAQPAPATAPAPAVTRTIDPGSLGSLLSSYGVPPRLVQQLLALLGPTT